MMDHTTRIPQKKQSLLAKVKEKLFKSKADGPDSDETPQLEIGKPYNVGGNRSAEHTGANKAFADANKREQLQENYGHLMNSGPDPNISTPKHNPDLGSGKPLKAIRLQDQRSNGPKAADLLQHAVSTPAEPQRRNSDADYGQMPALKPEVVASILKQNEQSAELQRGQNTRNVKGNVREQGNSKDLKHGKADITRK